MRQGAQDERPLALLSWPKFGSIAPKATRWRYNYVALEGAGRYTPGAVRREEWDERYRADELVWPSRPNQFLVEEVGALPPGRALDLACGEGRNALWLAEKGWAVTGVDFSRVGLSKARRLAADRGLQVDFVEADVLDWAPPAASFDLVVVMYLHLPAPSRRRALQSAARALAPRGTLLVVGHDSTNLEEGYGGPKDPAVLFSPEEIVRDLDDAGEAPLHIEKAQRVHRTVFVEPAGEGRSCEAVAIDALVRAVRNRPVPVQ